MRRPRILSRGRTLGVENALATVHCDPDFILTEIEINTRRVARGEES